MSRLPLIAGSLLLASSLTAQTAYAPPGDTLRFREVTLGDIRVTTPQGEFPIKSEHRATVAVLRVNADSARAWYESLAIAMAGPMGNQQPATDSALRAPFALRFDNRGKVQLMAAPQFPASFEGVTDLSHQFDDFFLRLPREALRIGLAWTDTSSRADSTAEKWSRSKWVASYRVERDTTVDGMRALVVSVKQQLSQESEVPMRDQPARIASILQGTDEGIFVFSPQAGRLLGRRREGSLSGDLLMKSGNGDFAMTQAYKYTSTLDAVRK